MADGPTILTASLTSVLPAPSSSLPITSIWTNDALSHTLHEVRRLHSLQTNDEKIPFKFKYEARKLLEAARASVAASSATASSASDDIYARHASADEQFGLIDHLIGLNMIDSEEVGVGEKTLMTAIHKLRHRPVIWAMELMDSLNQLAIVWSGRGEHRRALLFLQSVTSLYNSIQQQRTLFTAIATATNTPTTSATVATSSSAATPPSSSSSSVIDDSNPPDLLLPAVTSLCTSLPNLVHTSDSLWTLFDNRYTLTLYYLAQVHGHLKNASLSAQYCHQTLQRQLVSKLEFNPREWAANAMGIGTYYAGTLWLEQSYHCLAAAQYQLHPHLDKPFIIRPAVEIGEDSLPASLARAWGHLYLQWLKHSKNVKAGRFDDDREAWYRDPADAKAKPRSKGPQELNHSMSLFTLPIPAPPSCEVAITYEQAARIFKEGNKWLEAALQYFKLDGWVTDHILIQQDLSQLYKHLTIFEEDESRASKMHKRRIDRLEPILTAVNPKMYMEFHQQISDEIARAYTDMLDLKYTINEQRAEGKEKNSAWEKINQLAIKSIHYHKIWLSSFADKDGKAPEKLEPAYQRAYLTTLFAIARLYSRVMHTDPQTRVAFVKLAWQGYQQCIDVAAKNVGADVLFGEELEICREMVTLLPMKMDRIMRESNALDIERRLAAHKT